MFSIGVILFIIVQGIFPFKEARKEEYFYNLILSGQIETYFSKVNGQNLSNDFKDLILKMFSYNPEERMTLEQLKSHPWVVNSSMNNENMRQTLLQAAQAKTAE